jgi:hypothetical protein
MRKVEAMDICAISNAQRIATDDFVSAVTTRTRFQSRMAGRPIAAPRLSLCGASFPHGSRRE